MFYLSPKIPPSIALSMASDNNCYLQRDTDGNIEIIPRDVEDITYPETTNPFYAEQKS